MVKFGYPDQSVATFSFHRKPDMSSFEFNKVIGAVLLAVLTMVVIGKLGDNLVATGDGHDDSHGAGSRLRDDGGCGKKFQTKTNQNIY